MSRQLAEFLAKDKIITAAQFSELATSAAGNEKFSYIRAAIEKRFVSETKLLYYLSQRFGLASINLAKFEIKPEVLKLVPSEVARKLGAIPIQANPGNVVVAVCDPTHFINIIQDLKFRLKLNVEAVLTSYSAFDAAMAKYYGSMVIGQAIESYQREAKAKEATRTVEQKSDITADLAQVHQVDPNATEQDAPIIALVNGLLAESLRRGASDIHVEPFERFLRVRMRVDGSMVESANIPTEMKRAVVARFKIMSRMDISESRVPQDGRIKMRVGNQEIDFRVNAMPTLFGEKIVCRLLSKGNLQLDLQKLGFEPEQLVLFRKGIDSPNGMVLVTGPTGSGKTTTLYSALMELNKPGDNLSTAEDPVEYNLEGINQVQINKEVGLTFASVLRALLRQDPDTILVGEIRDYETAEVAIQAALTGHLVLSTLHTNDAPSTITRLVNMGVEPFLVVASLNTIVAQRLLRTICPKCRTEAPIPATKLTELGFPADQAARAKCFRGQGCTACNGTGYKGRVAIYEVLDFSPTLKEMVLRGESALEVRKAAIKEGMKTLRMSALTKVAEGRTSLEEAVSLTMES